MKKRIGIILVVLVLGVVAVGALYLSSKKDNERINGFRRNFQEYSVAATARFDIQYNSYYYFAGSHDDRLFLGNSVAKNHLLAVNLNSRDTQHIYVNIPPNVKMRRPVFLVSPSNIYLTDGLSAKIHEINLDSFKIERTLHSKLFDDAVFIKDTTFALRLSRRDKQSILARERGDSLDPKPGLLEKQVDGYFCTLGTLLYNSQVNKLYYVYNYRNEFFSMDTSLVKLYKCHTIDTISRAQIKIGRIDRDHVTTLAHPPRMVNRNAATDGQYLYIQSSLIADNEQKDVFTNSSVIDVYDITNNQYRFSFHIPNIKGHKMKDFTVLNGKLYTIHDHYLTQFSIEFGQKTLALTP